MSGRKGSPQPVAHVSGEEDSQGCRRKFNVLVIRTILSYIIFWKTERMAHTTKDKAKLLNRVRRIRGQVEAIERALDGEQECSSVLQLMAACRGALNGLMAEVLEGHIRFHVLNPKSGKNAPQVEAGEELIDVVRTYLK